MRPFASDGQSSLLRTPGCNEVRDFFEILPLHTGKNQMLTLHKTQPDDLVMTAVHLHTLDLSPRHLLRPKAVVGADPLCRHHRALVRRAPHDEEDKRVRQEDDRGRPQHFRIRSAPDQSPERRQHR